MDAMVGHRSIRYQAYGWASARLDDAAGYLPARLTAALVAGVRPGRAADIWRAVHSQAPGHPSPNAGVAEAAFAAALGLRLGGCNRYGERVEHRPWLGQGRPAARSDIRPAVRLSDDVNWLLAAIAGRCPPPVPEPVTIAVFAADHGVAAEGVTAWPQEVTAQMVANFCAGGAAINVLARHIGADVIVTDVGVATPIPSDAPGLVRRTVRPGTGNIAVEAAMTPVEARSALDVGAGVATQAAAV